MNILDNTLPSKNYHLCFLIVLTAAAGFGGERGLKFDIASIAATSTDRVVGQQH